MAWAHQLSHLFKQISKTNQVYHFVHSDPSGLLKQLRIGSWRGHLKFQDTITGTKLRFNNVITMCWWNTMESFLEWLEEWRNCDEEPQFQLQMLLRQHADGIWGIQWQHKLPRLKSGIDSNQLGYVYEDVWYSTTQCPQNVWFFSGYSGFLPWFIKMHVRLIGV